MMINNKPHHWLAVSDSCNIKIAPKSVHIGADERIGPTMEIGRNFIAKNENIHEAHTMILLTKIRNWSCGLVYGIKNTVPSNVDGDTDDRIIKGRNIKSEVADEMSMTNKTELPLSDSFLKIS